VSVSALFKVEIQLLRRQFWLGVIVQEWRPASCR